MSLMSMISQDPQFQDNTARVTRQGDAVLLKVPLAKTVKYARTPACRGSTDWNNRPIGVRKAKTNLEFKMRVRKYLQEGPINITT